jgi:hypothetical protein
MKFKEIELKSSEQIRKESPPLYGVFSIIYNKKILGYHNLLPKEIGPAIEALNVQPTVELLIPDTRFWKSDFGFRIFLCIYKQLTIHRLFIINHTLIPLSKRFTDEYASFTYNPLTDYHFQCKFLL